MVSEGSCAPLAEAMDDSGIVEDIGDSDNDQDQQTDDTHAPKARSFEEIISTSDYFKMYPKQIRKGSETDKDRFTWNPIELFPEGWYLKVGSRPGDKEFMSPDGVITRSRRAALVYMSCMDIYSRDLLDTLGAGNHRLDAGREKVKKKVKTEKIKKETEVSEYERIRDENIRQRLQMWEELGLQSAVDNCKRSSAAIIKTEKRMKQEARVSEQNTKTRLQEWEEEDGDKSPGFRKRRRRQSSTVTRKSARLAAVTESVCEDGDEDYDPNTELVNKPRCKPVRKLKKLQYFDEAVLVCSISFTSPTSSKKLFVNYWV